MRALSSTRTHKTGPHRKAIRFALKTKDPSRAPRSICGPLASEVASKNTRKLSCKEARPRNINPCRPYCADTPTAKAERILGVTVFRPGWVSRFCCPTVCHGFSARVGGIFGPTGCRCFRGGGLTFFRPERYRVCFKPRRTLRLVRLATASRFKTFRARI